MPTGEDHVSTQHSRTFFVLTHVHFSFGLFKAIFFGGTFFMVFRGSFCRLPLLTLFLALAALIACIGAAIFMALPAFMAFFGAAARMAWAGFCIGAATRMALAAFMAFIGAAAFKALAAFMALIGAAAFLAASDEREAAMARGLRRDRVS